MVRLKNYKLKKKWFKHVTRKTPDEILTLIMDSEMEGGRYEKI